MGITKNRSQLFKDIYKEKIFKPVYVQKKPVYVQHI
jgi:hypothetical protein